MSAKDALERYYARIDKSTMPCKRKNKKPEKQVAENCMRAMREAGFCMDIIEVSTYDPHLKRATSQRNRSGMSDSIGCDQNGFACYVEFKAPGRRSTLSELQRHFLLEKISFGAFAYVADCHKKLLGVYANWRGLRKTNIDESKSYLINQLPNKKTRAQNCQRVSKKDIP